MVGFNIDLDVDHAGPLVLEGDWSDDRVLSFRLDRPGSRERPVRRTGPPPLRLEVDVAAADVGGNEPWRLSIRGLPARGVATGHVTIALPDATVVKPSPPTPVPPPRVVEPEPWRRPLHTPRGLSADWAKLYRVTERFRLLVVEGSTKDNFRWQDDLLRFLARHRQRAESGRGALGQPTRNMLLRFVGAVEDVEALRTSDDPIFAGPPPRKRRQVWEDVRNSHIVGVERRLDDIMHDLQRRHAPELRHEGWCVRFVSSLIVCQRHFDERVRLAPTRWKHREAAEQQWETVLAASEVFAALAGLQGP